MKSAATRVHALARLSASKKLASLVTTSLDGRPMPTPPIPIRSRKARCHGAFLPGVAGWEDVYNHPGIWHSVSTAPHRSPGSGKGTHLL